MNVGMLWFDNDPKVGIEAKIERAAQYYANKYGKSPNVCFVHPSMLIKAAETPPPALANRIQIRTTPTVMPNHFWIGVNGTLKSSES